MKIINDFETFYKENDYQTAITIGNFDGIHKGHKKLISTVKKYAKERNLKSLVITFSPHPLEVIRKDIPFYYIFSKEEKAIEMEKEGIDYLFNIPFDEEFSKISPEKFIDILVDKLKCKILVVGEDYCFGKDRMGNFDMLKRISKNKGIEVIKIEKIQNNYERISSTRIREALKSKDIEMVNELLDKKYYIFGEVVKGNQLGRTIGFPTANVITSKNKLLPPDGVYITMVSYKNNIYKSITNIAKNPTVNNRIRTVETNLFDFSGNLYGEKIFIYFYKWLRDVKKFDNIQILKQQIEEDVLYAKEYFDNLEDN